MQIRRYLISLFIYIFRSVLLSEAINYDLNKIYNKRLCLVHHDEDSLLVFLSCTITSLLDIDKSHLVCYLLELILAGRVTTERNNEKAYFGRLSLVYCWLAWAYTDLVLVNIHWWMSNTRKFHTLTVTAAYTIEFVWQYIICHGQTYTVIDTICINKLDLLYCGTINYYYCLCSWYLLCNNVF